MGAAEIPPQEAPTLPPETPPGPEMGPAEIPPPEVSEVPAAETAPAATNSAPPGQDEIPGPQ